MTPSFDALVARLRKLPGIGYRSAERIGLHLLVEQPVSLPELVTALKDAAERVRRCATCGSIAESEQCALCADPTRDATLVCVVEQVPDLVAMERAGSYRGRYHVLHGKLSPIHGVGPEQLNLESLLPRIEQDGVTELILALSNDVEGEATCHYLSEQLTGKVGRITRIGFGLPSGGGVLYADSTTLKSALDGRRSYL